MEIIDIHGRSLTTGTAAAAWYRAAQQAPDRPAAVRALERAVQADPGFAVAAADLECLATTPPPPTGAALHVWERHHIEIVRTVLAGRAARARALLSEHLTTVACDPIVTAIAASDPSLSRCHHPAWIVADLHLNRSASAPAKW